MPQDLLRRVLEQSEHSAAPIKAAALLHIARVLTQFDYERARSADGGGKEDTDEIVVCRVRLMAKASAAPRCSAVQSSACFRLLFVYWGNGEPTNKCT